MRRAINWIKTLKSDLRCSVRTLTKNPGLTIGAVLALALAIGANSAILNVVLVRPLPFRDPQQLVMVWENVAHLGSPKNMPSPANYRDWKRQTTVFQSMAAMTPRRFKMTGAGKSEQLDGRRVSVGFFELLGVKPFLGRNFVQDEAHRVATDDTHALLLSYELWQRRFGSDPSIIGRVLTLNGERYTVIGIMPANTRLPGSANVSDQLWVPIDLPKDEAALRGSHYLEVIARLQPGVTLPQAQAEMDKVSARLARVYPETNMDTGAVVVPLHEHWLRDIQPSLLLLLGAIGLVLLIACTYTANLFLARAPARKEEVAKRLDLGRSRLRLARQFHTESILIVLLGGAMGLLLAFAGINILKSSIFSKVSHTTANDFDWYVLLFTVLISIVTGVILRFMPAFRISHFDLDGRLIEASRDYRDAREGAMVSRERARR